MVDSPIASIAVLRLDGDLYTSTMDVLQPLYPRVSPCGYILVDDYGYFIQCRRAVDDYFESAPLKVNWVDDTGVWFPRPDRPGHFCHAFEHASAARARSLSVF